MKTAIFPGSFDPVTKGHVDIIKRAVKLCDKLIVAVLENPEKNSLFSVTERTTLLKKALYNFKNVEILQFDGLLVDFAKKVNATIIIRGLRTTQDFEYELQMALTNKSLDENIETVFLTTSLENIYISSTTVKQIAKFKKDLSGLVPKCISDDILKKFI